MIMQIMFFKFMIFLIIKIIKKQFNIIKKLEDFFSFKKENDISRLVFLIINDKLIRERIINCEENKEIQIFKKKGFFKKVKLFFKKEYIDTFEDNEEILAYLDFEFIKHFLLKEILPENWNYSQKIQSIYNHLKKNKYEKKKNNEIKNKVNSKFGNNEGLKIKKINIELLKQYSSFSKHDINFTISQNEIILYKDKFEKAGKKIEINLQKNEIYLEKKILKIELVIKGNSKDHFRQGKYDLKNVQNGKAIILKILKENSTKPSGYVKVIFC